MILFGLLSHQLLVFALLALVDLVGMLLGWVLQVGFRQECPDALQDLQAPTNVYLGSFALTQTALQAYLRAAFLGVGLCGVCPAALQRSASTIWSNDVMSAMFRIAGMLLVCNVNGRAPSGAL
jgi:hypothetical protein